MKNTKQGAQSLWMKMGSTELYFKGATVVTPCSRLQQDWPNWRKRWKTSLAYGWRGGNLNWPITIQQGGKIITVLPSIVSRQERHWNQATFLIGDRMKYSRKGIYNSQNHITLQKVKNMKHFVSPASNLAPKMVVPLALPGRITVDLFWTKYAVRRQIKSGIF